MRAAPSCRAILVPNRSQSTNRPSGCRLIARHPIVIADVSPKSSHQHQIAELVTSKFSRIRADDSSLVSANCRHTKERTTRL